MNSFKACDRVLSDVDGENVKLYKKYTPKIDKMWLEQIQHTLKELTKEVLALDYSSSVSTRQGKLMILNFV